MRIAVVKRLAGRLLTVVETWRRLTVGRLRVSPGVCGVQRSSVAGADGGGGKKLKPESETRKLDIPSLHPGLGRTDCRCSRH